MRGDPFDWRSEPGGSAVSIGVYDGVHLGHREVLRDLRTWADAKYQTVVLTFDQHPLSVLAPDLPIKLLTTEEQRLELFAAEGIDTVGLLPFSQIRMLDPGRFVEEVLREALEARLVVVGADFRFGRDRAGDTAFLKDAGARAGFEVRLIPLVEDESHEVYSSTIIRSNIMNGNVGAAAESLGRPFELRGTVVSGEGRGRSIGVPTANVQVPEDMAVPGRGVYAVKVVIAGDMRDGVVNVGVRPTFGGDREWIEAHVLDFDEDLYGHSIAVRFIAKLRDERAFDSVDELIAQIHRDIDQARTVLSDE